MKYIRLLLCIVMSMTFIAPINAAEQSEEKKGIDLQEVLFGHIQDSYDWHITTVNGHHVTLHLPIIVKSSTGWHVFCSSEFSEEKDAQGNRPGPHGLYISGSGENENKVCENVAGTEVRPFDISITKSVTFKIKESVCVIVSPFICFVTVPIIFM